jgi:hypothetical protein
MTNGALGRAARKACELGRLGAWQIAQRVGSRRVRLPVSGSWTRALARIAALLLAYGAIFAVLAALQFCALAGGAR